jgi:hypothetical protein
MLRRLREHGYRLLNRLPVNTLSSTFFWFAEAELSLPVGYQGVLTFSSHTFSSHQFHHLVLSMPFRPWFKPFSLRQKEQ